MGKPLNLDEQEVIELYHQLKSSEKVAKELNCSPYPILCILKKHKVKVYGFQGIKGKENPNYGKKMSEEQKRKLSKNKKGKSWEEWMGKEKADKLKEKFSKKMKGKNNPFFGKTHTKEFKEWSSRTHKGKTISKKHKKAISKKLKGRPNFHGHKISAHYKNNPNAYTKERRQKARERIITRMKNGEMVKSISGIERKLKREMERRGINFEDQYSIKRFLFDFAISEKRILIEADGDYFHYNPEIYKGKEPDRIQKRKMAIDKNKNTFAKEHKWKLLRFWETEINKDVKSCVDIIEKAISSTILKPNI